MKIAAMLKLTIGSTLSVLGALPASAAEYHVAKSGNDHNPGTIEQPLLTISAAAARAMPGDTITVHEGIYRERVNPPRGGVSDRRRIVYRAAPGQHVVITGAEVIKNWTHVQGSVWKATLPNTFFGDFNPYSDRIHGDWFNPKDRDHHTGAVYLNGHWLAEAARPEDVFAEPGPQALWFARVDDAHTTIWAQFADVNPNEALVEINVRQTVFYPDQPGRNYITVRGFTLCQAATPWAPPTAEQIGLIGTHWSKGWIIEDNTIAYSTCAGLTLGKHGDEFDNTSANSAEGYVKTIERALAHPIPWSKDHIGRHIVRRNHIAHCEQGGIIGSLGGAFSTITDNVIHDIHVRRLFGGSEMAGIKLHGAIDTEITGNHIHHTVRGLWLDWMAQGTRVSRNLLHDNTSHDLFLEVNHGPFVVDNNLLLSPVSVLDISEGGAFAHNLFAGKIITRAELDRETPYHRPHDTAIAGLAVTRGGDNRFFNNIFVGGTLDDRGLDDWIRKMPHAHGFGLFIYDDKSFPSRAEGNVYLRGAQPGRDEANPVVLPGYAPGIRLVEAPAGWRLEISLDAAWAATRHRKLVTTEWLGRARVPDLPFENAVGEPIAIGIDYFGKARAEENPFPGPFTREAFDRASLRVAASCPCR